jgi:hypothetical protein
VYVALAPLSVIVGAPFMTPVLTPHKPDTTATRDVIDKPAPASTTSHGSPSVHDNTDAGAFGPNSAIAPTGTPKSATSVAPRAQHTV